MRWVSEGFLRAGKRGDRRDPISLQGRAFSKGSRSTWFELGVDYYPDEPEGLKGASGSPVFVKGSIIGVIQSCLQNFKGRMLRATPVWCLLEDEGFCQAIQRYTHELRQVQKDLQRLVYEANDILEALGEQLHISSEGTQQEWAADVAKTMLNLPCQEVIGVLDRIHRTCCQDDEIDDAGICVQIVNRILPATYDLEAVTNAIESIQQGQVVLADLPIPNQTCAEIIMAGVDNYRAAEFEKPQDSLSLPFGKLKLPDPPETGMDPDGKGFQRAWEDFIIEKFSSPHDWKQFHSDQTLTRRNVIAKAAREMAYQTEYLKRTVYYVFRHPLSQRHLSSWHNALEHIKQSFPSLVFINLCEELVDPSDEKRFVFSIVRDMYMRHRGDLATPNYLIPDHRDTNYYIPDRRETRISKQVEPIGRILDYSLRRHILRINSLIKTESDDSTHRASSLCEEASQASHMDAAIGYYEKARNVEKYYLKAWKGLEELYRKKGDQIKQKQAYDYINTISEVIRFENNVDNELLLSGLKTKGINFFGSINRCLKPNINILLGRNGYGKSYLLRMIAAMLKNDADIIQDYFSKDTSSSSYIKIQTTNAIQDKDIVNANGFFTSSFGEIPVLAFPDLRYIDRSKLSVENKTTDSDQNISNLRYFGSFHFLSNRLLSGIIETFLFNICTEHLSKGSFDLPVFTVIQGIFEALTDEGIKFVKVKSLLNETGYTLYVRTEGNQQPLPIQKVSQGTLSILAIFGIIYYYLRLMYVDSVEAEITHKRAIVLIEELDAHLHPSWQQKVINLLRSTFPNIQFLVTAHNPLVVAGCYENEVAILRESSSGYYVSSYEDNLRGENTDFINQRIFDIRALDGNYYHHLTDEYMKTEYQEELDKIMHSGTSKNKLNDEDIARVNELRQKLAHIDKAIKVKAKLDKSERSIDYAMLEEENRELKSMVKKTMLGSKANKEDEGEKSDL